MNLSSRSRYGIRALIDLAVNARESCIQLGDIAVRNDISVKYLEQIFMSLRKGGMIRSIKGPQGGYLLARTPEEICWMATISWKRKIQGMERIWHPGSFRKR